jgi:hypothetical protein
VCRDAKGDGIGWNFSQIYKNISGGDGIAIALDNNDTPHITYSADPGAKYAKWNGTIWNIETIDLHGTANCIALDNIGNPHISYVDPQNTNYNKLKYAVKNGTKWNTDLIYTAKSVNEAIQATSLAVDKDGYSHIAFWSGGLRYATNKPVVQEITMFIIPSIALIALFVIIKRKSTIQQLI